MNNDFLLKKTVDSRVLRDFSKTKVASAGGHSQLKQS